MTSLSFPLPHPDQSHKSPLSTPVLSPLVLDIHLFANPSTFLNPVMSLILSPFWSDAVVKSYNMLNRSSIHPNSGSLSGALGQIATNHFMSFRERERISPPSLSSTRPNATTNTLYPLQPLVGTLESRLGHSYILNHIPA